MMLYMIFEYTISDFYQGPTFRCFRPFLMTVENPGTKKGLLDLFTLKYLCGFSCVDEGFCLRFKGSTFNYYNFYIKSV